MMLKRSASGHLRPPLAEPDAFCITGKVNNGAAVHSALT